MYYNILNSATSRNLTETEEVRLDTAFDFDVVFHHFRKHKCTDIDPSVHGCLVLRNMFFSLKTCPTVLHHHIRSVFY